VVCYDIFRVKMRGSFFLSSELSFTVDFSQHTDLAICHDPTTFSSSNTTPVTFEELEALTKTHKLRVDAFDLTQPSVKPFKAGSWVARVAEGASVNVSEFTICPHGSGTHTEALGHIVADNRPIHSCFDLARSHHPGLLLTVEATLASECKDTYPTLEPSDLVITKTTLEAAVERVSKELGIDVYENPSVCKAVVLRVNACKHAKLSVSKQDKTLYIGFTSQNPPYFTADCSALLIKLGVHHLITDLPSVDKENDGGHLVNHKAIFLRKDGTKTTETAVPSTAEECPYSITEFCYIPPSVKEGLYLVDLQIAPLVMDASPSRPVLYSAILSSK